MNKPKQQLTKFPTLATERLILRQLAQTDIPELIKLRTDPEVNQYLERPKSMRTEEAAAFINKINDGLKNGWYYWVISLTGDQKLIGTICLWNFDEINRSIEIGYELMPAFHGNGLMREALAEVISFGFDALHLRSIIATVTSANKRSTHLLERSGFTLDLTLTEKLLTEEPGTAANVYSLSSPLQS